MVFFILTDGSRLPLSFKCRGADGFGEVAGKTVFGCNIVFRIGLKTALNVRSDLLEDPANIEYHISTVLRLVPEMRTETL